MLLLSLHACGFLAFILNPAAFRIKKLIQVAIAGITLILLAATVWITFFGALSKAYVPYKEAAHAYQIQPGLFIGLFDDVFYRAFNSGWLVSNPSANFWCSLAAFWH